MSILEPPPAPGAKRGKTGDENPFVAAMEAIASPSGTPTAGMSKPKTHGRGKKAYVTEPRPLTEYQKFVKANFGSVKGKAEARARIKQLAAEWKRLHPEAGIKKKKPQGDATTCQRRKALTKATMHLALRKLVSDHPALFRVSCATPKQRAAGAQRAAAMRLAKSLGQTPARKSAPRPKKMTAAQARSILEMFEL